MDPISIGVLAAGTLLGAMSSISSAQTQAANYQAQANAQNYNAQLYQQQAQNTIAQANADANLQYNRSEQALGMQRAATAESGIGFDGTGGDLINQSAANAALDRENILYSGLINANSLNAQAAQSSYVADVAQSQIAPATAAGYMGAAGNLLSGTGSYMSYNRNMNRVTNAGGAGYYNPNALSNAAKF